MVACKREMPVHLNTLNDEMVPGTITSVELEDPDAPWRIIHNGLPSMALHPGEPGLSNIVLNAIDEQHDIQDNVHDDDEIIKYVDTFSEDEISEINKGGSGYMAITEGKAKIRSNLWRKWRRRIALCGLLCHRTTNDREGCCREDAQILPHGDLCWCGDPQLHRCQH